MLFIPVNPRFTGIWMFVSPYSIPVGPGDLIPGMLAVGCRLMSPVCFLKPNVLSSSKASSSSSCLLDTNLKYISSGKCVFSRF